MNLKSYYFFISCVAVMALAILSCNDPVSNPQPSKAPGFTVTYDGNGNTGGTVPIDNNGYLTGAKVTVKPNSGALTRTGFAFSFWSTKADGSGKSYSEDDTFSMGSADVVLYAIWDLSHEYSVIYDGNGNTGGTVPKDINKYKNGDRVTTKPNSGGLVKTGSSFACWNNTMEGTGTDFPVDSQFSMGCTDLILYAKWTTP
jgi:hypothetical protein